LLHRYGDINYVLKLPLKRALKLIVKAREEETRDALYQFWLARYPLYTEKNYESFNEFCEAANPVRPVTDARTKADIMQELKSIEKQFGKEGANGTI
jgi:hypothetical protein